MDHEGEWAGEVIRRAENRKIYQKFFHHILMVKILLKNEDKTVRMNECDCNFTVCIRLN